jgi:hypothetical protein
MHGGKAAVRLKARRTMRTFIAATALLALVVAIPAAEQQKTPAPLESRLSAKVEGEVSLNDRKLPLVLTFTNKTDKVQKFDNGSYIIVLLDSNGEQIDNALLVPTVLRTITLKGATTADRPGLSIAEGKLKEGEEYYVVVSVRNLTALAKFKAKK